MHLTRDAYVTIYNTPQGGLRVVGVEISIWEQEKHEQDGVTLRVDAGGIT